MFLLNAKKYCGKTYKDYTIIKPVGEGRYGMCFLAHSISGMPVIIKRFKPGIFKKNKEKNEHEAVILSQLRHNSIPELLGVINEKGIFAFVLEYKPGMTVKDFLFKQKHKFDAQEFFDIGTQLIEIVKYLHKNGVVHRDIRIPNVLIDNGKVYLVDFGLARWANNGRYRFDVDFSYLGDFFLYLLYSTFEKKERKKKVPWYEELLLSDEQKLLLKRLLGLEPFYVSIYEVEKDFTKVFGISI